MAITAIKFRILTAKYAESIQFYEKILGLRVVEQWNQEDDLGTILGLGERDADGFLELACSADAVDISGLSLQFRVPDIDRFLQTLAGEWQHSEPRRKPWGSTYVSLTDPNGIPVIIFDGDI